MPAAAHFSPQGMIWRQSVQARRAPRPHKGLRVEREPVAVAITDEIAALALLDAVESVQHIMKALSRVETHGETVQPRHPLGAGGARRLPARC